MAANSKIQWCDHTFQCVKCSPQGNRIVKAESGWKEPLKWDRAAKEACERHRVFCASLADVFEDWTGIMLDAESVQLWKAWDADKWKASADRPRPRWSPLIMQDVRNRLFCLIDATPNLDWMLLTKRPENIAKMMPEWQTDPTGLTHLNWPRPNLWLGVSVENQQAADERIPILLRTPAAVRFLSCEPLLDQIDLEKVAITVSPGYFGDSFHAYHRPGTPQQIADLPPYPAIDWVIVGGESGPKARPCGVEWIRSVVEQCKAASVPVFVKQMGGNIITRNDMIEDVFNNGESGWPDPQVEHNINGFREDHQGADCRIRLNDKKGGDMTEWPEDMRVRQMPKGPTT